MSGTTLPTVMTTAGLQPQSPSSLRSQLLAMVANVAPGYTADLPGSLIDDIAGTAVGALVVCDQARVELVNSITPYGANAFLLNQLGQMYGVPQGVGSNTSVYVVFTGPAGFVINAGFTVSDGTYQYVAQDGGIIGASGQSTSLYCVASQGGTFPVAPNTVTQLITSVPTGITLTVTNPQAGTPGLAPQSVDDYRVQVLQAGYVQSQGTAAYLKTLLNQVPGVQSRLVSVVQGGSGGWEVICGGGDPYQVANAIYQAGLDVSTLVGSATTTRNNTVTISDYPDAYSIIFVTPPQQIVTISLTWNTNSTNLVSPSSIAQLGSPALVNYVNSIPVGQPINLFELQAAFQDSVTSILSPQLLTRMVFTVEINGTAVSPTSGTGIIAGDSESYFETSSSNVTIVQG